MRVSTPVNEAASADLRGRPPQIARPLMVGVFGTGALSASIVWRALSSTRGTGRTQRFVDLATATLDSGFPVRVHEVGAGEGRAPYRVVHTGVGESLGRPSLVPIDIVVTSSDVLSEHEVTTRALDAITRITWDSPEVVPVSVCARVLLAHDGADDLEASGAQTDTVVDMSTLGFADKIARLDKPYDRYGTPGCGSVWRS